MSFRASGSEMQNYVMNSMILHLIISVLMLRSRILLDKKGWIYEEDPRGWFQWYCRHSSITQLAEADYDITAISALAGHSTITTTQKYIHRSIGNLRNIANNRKGKIYP